MFPRSKSAVVGSSMPDDASPRPTASSPTSIANAKDAVRTPAMAARSASATSARPARKLVIRPFKKQPQLPAQFFAETWDRCLRQAVHAVHNTTAVSFSYEQLYQKVEDLCRHKFAPELYDALRLECERHVALQITKLKSPGQTLGNVEYLALVDRCWQDHCSQMLTLGSIFLFLDRSYVIHSGRTRSLWDMGLDIFRKYLVQNIEVENRVVAGILSLVGREREGDSISHPLVKNLLRIFTAVGRYASHFEKQFLETTDLYYRNEGSQLVQTNAVPAYLCHVEQRIKQEMERVMNILDIRTEKPLVDCVEHNLLALHVQVILDKGFDTLCDENRREDLARLYRLFARIDKADQDETGASAHELMRDSFMRYVKRVGAEIVMDTEKDSEMVDLLLAYKAKLDDFLRFAFEDNAIFARALKEAFESFVNMRQNVPAQLIAKFIDNILRTGNKGFSDEQLEDTLEKVMTLFRYIHGKDIFEAFYKKFLSKRLLFQKSASHDLEKTVLAKLKSECGAAFTNKLEGMFKDVDVSKDIMQAFNQHVSGRSRPSEVELNVYVLTTSYWPTSAHVEIKLPKELIDVQETFRAFYTSNHKGRHLSWLHSGGTCLLKANFPLGQKLLDVSLYQAVVLLLFNETEEMTFADVLDQTGIEGSELRRTLLSLASGKPSTRVLEKRPKGPTVENTDIFVFNKDFEHKLRRVKINAIQIKETKEENQQTQQKVFQERDYLIDAAIVRIMKTRKVMAHSQLIGELFEQLKFPHKPADLKKRIESLLERDYIERDEYNPHSYKYLA